jgi:hypothetical protein
MKETMAYENDRTLFGTRRKKDHKVEKYFLDGWRKGETS